MSTVPIYIGESGTKRRSVFNVNIWRFVLVFTILGLISWYITGGSRYQALNWYVTLIWSLNVPLAVISFLGIVALKRYKVNPSRFSGTIDKKVIFIVPSVARLSVIPALKRVIDSIIEFAPLNLENFRIDIVVDEGSEGISILQEIYGSSDLVRILVVPHGYSTTNGTKYKARANEYAMGIRASDGENCENTWVYHLDDDTSVRYDTIASIAEFISKKGNELYLAQGVLTFPYERSDSAISRFADSIRPIDDLSKFYFFTGGGTPRMGLHGEHLLIRGDIEETIGWDFGSRVKVEDAYFALFFAKKYPGKSGFLNSATYGSSPSSVRDLVKQRRRWSSGLIHLISDKSIHLRDKKVLSYAVFIWLVGFAQNVWVVILVGLLIGQNTAPIFRGVVLLWSFNMAFQMWSYMEGVKINLGVSEKGGVIRKYLHMAMAIPGVFLIPVIESIASLLGLIEFLLRKEGFDVIQKRI
ncbi:MAG: glycosyltransferase family 2 protein [Patescibacteria group bacterium]